MKARNWNLRSLAGAALLAAAAGSASAQPTIAPAAPAAPAASTTPSPAAGNASASSGKLAAVVNGEAIPLAELDNLLKGRLDMLFKGRSDAPNPTPDQVLYFKLEFLGEIIDDRLLRQFLRANASPAKDVDINKKMVELETNLKAGGHTLQEFYRENGLTEARVRESFAGMIQWVNYERAHLSDSELKHYYEENREVFDEVTVRASHILIRLQATATEADRKAARAQLEAVRKEVLFGKLDFAEAAKKYSQCPSKSQGGDIGYFPRKYAVDENFAHAAFALKPGQVSDVVTSPMGLHLIKVLDRKQGTQMPFEKLKDRVRDVASDELRMKLVANQRKAAKIEILLEGAPALKTPGPARP